MFEPPFTGDFDLDVEFGSSLQHPFSLRSRLREVREAFRGFRPPYSTVLHNESKLTTPRKTTSIASSSIANNTSSCNACVALRKPMKEIEVAIQFLHEVIRTDKYEVLIGSASAVFDAVLAYIALLKYPVPHVQQALIKLLDWVENKILCSDIYDDVTSQSESSSNGEGVRLATELLKAIMETEENSQDTNLKSRKDAIVDKLHNMHESISEKLNDPGFENTFDNDATSFSGRSVENSGSTDITLDVQSLDDLLAQLNLRQVAKFEPIFPQVENDDTDEDDSDTIHEKREEREEKKDTKTCEEEVQKLSDGSEIRTRKTKTFNMKQNSKQVTIRSHGNSGNETVNIFHDGNMSFKNDLATDNFFTSRKPSVHTDLNRSKHFNDVLESTDKSNNESECISQKIRSVHHTDTVSQRVSKTAMKNGKIVWDDAAHKIDKNELNATQVEIFKNDKIIGRQGSGSYEEKSTVKMGLTQLSSSPPIPPKQRHVVQYMQTFGNEREDQDDFFKGSTLASYITLNDNLRYYEEQYKKQISFEFSLSGTTMSNQTFCDLSQFLQYTETDRIMLPKRYIFDMDENEVASKGIILSSLVRPENLEILECTDVIDWLVLRTYDTSSKPSEVRGGPKDALIAYATQPSGSLLYQEAFLTTYRSFVTPDELIQKLIKRYLYMSAINEQSSVKVARQTFSMLVRVVDELCTVELTRKLIRSITTFINRLVENENYTFARIIRRRLMARMEQKFTQKVAAIFVERPNFRGSNFKQMTIFDIRSAVVAKQMTFLDAELFHMIEPAEMLWWAQEQNEKKSPNLCRFTEHFNKVSYWVRTLVLVPHDQRTREKVMMKFIKIMKHLRTICNYNSYLAILSALDSGPIRRLDWSKYIIDLLKEHSVIMDSSHSFKNYRTLLGESHPPCLPYIGLVLQDLTFVHIGNSDYLSLEQSSGRKNLLNYGKRWQQFAILDSIRRFKSWNYSIEKDEKVIQFFNGFNHYLDEDEVWDLSESIKPRIRKNI